MGKIAKIISLERFQSKRVGYGAIALVFLVSIIGYAIFLRPSEVNAATSITTKGSNKANRQIVRTKSDTIYAFVNCKLWKSANGASWAEQDSASANKPSCSQAALSITIDSSNIIYLAYVKSICSGLCEAHLFISTFNTSNDTYSSSTDLGGGGGFDFPDLSLTVDSNNKLHLLYMQDDATTDVNYRNNVSGSWSGAVEVATTYAYNISAAINKDDVPELSWNDGTDIYAARGNQNNATSFTVTASLATAGDLTVSHTIDPYGNSWTGYKDNSSGHISLRKHNYADGWTTWQTAVNNAQAGLAPSLAAADNKIYVFYENSSDDIVYDVYNGSSFAGATTIQTGTYASPVGKWSYKFNNHGNTTLDYLFDDGTTVYWDKITLASRVAEAGNSLASITGQRKTVRSSNGTLVMVYNGGAHGSPGQLVFKTSSDNGVSWSTASQIDGTSASSDLSIAIDSSDNVYVAYTASALGTGVYFRKLTYSGGSWTVGSSIELFAPDACGTFFGDGVDYSKPSITVNAAGRIIVTAYENIMTFDGLSSCYMDGEAIYSRLSADGGSTFDTQYTLDALATVTDGNFVTPMISVGNDVWAITYEGNIYKDTAAFGSWSLQGSVTVSTGGFSLCSAGSDQLDIMTSTGSGISYRKYTISTGAITSTTISNDSNDRPGDISCDSSTGKIWIFYRDYAAVNSYNIAYKHFNSSSWDVSPTALTSDNLNNTSVASVQKKTGSAVYFGWDTSDPTPAYTIKSGSVAAVTNSSPSVPELIEPISSATGIRGLPTFRFRSSEPDGDYLQYKIEVCSNSDCSSVLRTIDQTVSQIGWSGQDANGNTAYIGNSNIVSSTIAAYLIQPPGLSANTQYWWRAYAIDPAGSNTWSSPSSIQTFTVDAVKNVEIRGGSNIQGGGWIY